MADLTAQAQLWLDPRIHDHHLDRLKNPQPSPTVRIDKLDRPESDQLCSYVEKIVRHGLRALAVDLTTPDVRSAGLHVARIVVPGLYGNAPPAFPLFGGERLYNEPYRLGLVPWPLQENDLIRRPLPYA